MIRAAIEIGGALMVIAAIGAAAIYLYYKARLGIRQLKREDAADAKAHPEG